MAIDFESIFQRALNNLANRANEPVVVDSKAKSNTDPKKRYFKELTQEELTIGSEPTQATEEEDN